MTTMTETILLQTSIDGELIDRLFASFHERFPKLCKIMARLGCRLQIKILPFSGNGVGRVLIVTYKFVR